MDDLPVGQKNENDRFNEGPGAEKNNADADKPLEERLVSKNWSTRADAFKEICDQFKKAPNNCANESFRDYASKWQQFLSDANPGSLEKALEAFQAYLDRAKSDLVSQLQIATIKTLVEKCLSHAKPTIKTKSLECTLCIFEISENFDFDTQDAIEELCKSKQIKTQITAINLLASLFTAFGVKKFPIARYQPHIEAMANHSNPAARTEAMNCYKALYLWLGDAVNAFMEKLKAAQVEAVKKEFAEHKEKNKTHKRLTRTEKAKQKEAELDAIIAEETKEEVVDVFDIAPETKILTTFTPEWIDAVLALKKWDEKRDKMLEIATAADVAKLAAGNYGDLTQLIKKFLGDSNVNVSQAAVKAVGSLAKGLRKEFQTLAKEMVPVLFGRFKEKKLLEDVQTTLTKFLMCVDLNELIEFLPAGLKDKSPEIKRQVAIFIERALLTTYIDQLEEIQGELIPAVQALIDEKDNDVREQGIKTFGVLLGRLGEQVLLKYTDGVIPQKKTKIEEAAATVKPSKYDKSQKKAAAAAAAAKKVPVAKKPAPPKLQQKLSTSVNDQQDQEQDQLITVKKVVAIKKEIPSESLNTDDKPAVVRKPPPNIGQKPPPKPTATSTSTVSKPTGTAKPTQAIQANDEDMGSGMSKEEAIEKVEQFYQAAYVAKFEEAKWQDKVEGFKGIQQQIEELKPDAVILEATARFIKIKMKDWKESNINLMKEAIECLRKMTECCERIPKRALWVYAPYLTDKIGDVKFATSVKELLMTLADFVTAKFVASQVIKYAVTAKAPNNLKESCVILAQLIEEWGSSHVPVKDCIDYATLAANNPNVQVRNASMQLFAVLYKHLGETVKNYLTDIKESTMKLIEEEFSKITPYKKGEFKSSRELKGEAQEEMAAAGGAPASFEDSLPREDISKQLNAKLLALFKDKDWKKRKEGADAVLDVLKAAKMRIEPNGVGELMEILKGAMKEANKAVIKSNIQLLGSLAEAMGAPIKQYTKKCFIPMLFNLSDKQSLVRDEVIACMNQWSEAIGPETVIQYACAQLETENPELREEGLKWILAHKEGIKGADHTIMVKPLVDCLLDKVSKIRQQAEEIIVEVMTYTGFEPFSRVAKDLKTAVQQQVRPLLEKAKAKCGTGLKEESKQEESRQTVTKPNQAPAQPTKRPQTAAGPTLKQDAPLRSLLDAAKSPPRNTFAVALQNPDRATRPTLAQTTSNFNKKDEADDEPLVVNTGNKDKRALADGKSKWMHEELKPEQIEKVKNLSEQLFGYDFMQKMFSADFKKHQLVLKAFQDLITNQPETLKDCLDVIVKWSYIKLAESSNTTFAVCVFDFFQQLIEFFVIDNYQLWDHEAYVFIPLLCDKSGINNAILKEKVKKLLKQCFSIHDPKKCVQLMFKFGVGAKNLKSVAECLDELSVFVRENGLDHITEKDLQLVAKMVDSNDKGVREGALTLIGEIYKTIDEQIWRLLGPVNIKVKGLLEGRFKQVKKVSGVDLMNRSINQALQTTPPPDPSRRTMAPQTNPLNRSLVQNSNANPVPSTPRKIGGIPKANSGLQSLTKSISKQNNLNSSINSNNGQAQSKQLQASSSVAVMSQPSKIASARQPLKFQAGFVEDSSLRQSEVQKKPGSFLQEFSQQDSRQTIQQQSKVEQRIQKTVFEDDDEDLIQQINEIEKATQPKEQLDPILKEKIDTVMKHVQSLKYGDLSKRVDSLVALNDIITNISQYTEAIVRCTNEICAAFTHVLVDVFERPLQDIPLRFAKYFVTIVNRVCSSPEVMNSANEKVTYELAEQLLFRLLTENLDKLGENKEGEVILKTLNAGMLRLLENCQPSHIYCALFNLLRKYKDYTVLPKLPGLVIKCLLKLAKIIEKQTQMLEIDKILLVIHEYLLVINHDEKSQNDEMGIRISKTVVNELVKIKGEQIWDSYKLVERHLKADNHVKRWIQLILEQPRTTAFPGFGVTQAASNQINPTATFGSQQQSSSISSAQKQDEIKQIIDELRNTDLFEAAIVKLHNFLQRHPEETLNMHIKDLSAHFANFIRTHLEQYSNSLVETGSTPHGQKVSEPQDIVVLPERQSSLQQPSGQSFLARQSLDKPTSMSAQQNSRIQTQGIQRSQNNQNNGSTGSAVNQQSSDQRISSYQDKLASMRDKLQRSGSNSNLAPSQQDKSAIQNDQVVPPVPGSIANKPNSQLPKPSPSLQGQASQKASGQLNTSFSQMNSSLSQKWSQMKNKQGDAQQQMNTSSGMGSGNVAQSFSSGQEGGDSNTNKINSGGDSNRMVPIQQATPNDLQSKLAAMKAKLANLSQKK